MNSVSIPVMDTNGKIVVKNVSGTDNINKEFALVEIKTLDDQEKLVEEIIKLMEYLHSIEINTINHYNPLKNLKDIHHSQYNEYVNYMRTQILHMEEITKNINHKIDILKNNIKNLNKIIDTHQETIESNIEKLLEYIDSEKDRIDNSLKKLLEDLSKINETNPNDVITQYIEKINEQRWNAYNTLKTNYWQYRDELKTIKNDFNSLIGDMKRLNEHIDNYVYQISFESSHQDKEEKLGILWDIIYEFQMKNNEVKQYINPDNFELNIKVLNNIKETINILKSKDILCNTHIQNINNELKTREGRINNIIRDIISTVENLKKEENKIISNDKQAVIDEIKYVEDIIDNKKIPNVNAKETELIKRKESIKNKKYDAETRAIIELLYTEALEKLEAEKSGKIPTGTAYKYIKTNIRKINENLKTS